MNDIFREKLFDDVNFTYIPKSKFKTAMISFSMFTPLSKDEAAKNAILPNLLSHSCKKYPTLRSIGIKLEELYGASVGTSISKLGDYQVLTLCAEGLEGKFAYENPNNISELTNLLCEMIFNPDLEEGKFKEENVAQEKRQLIEDIMSEMNDKRIYATRRCEEIMFSEEKYGVNVLGDIKTAKKLTAEEITQAWKKLLSSSHIEIMVIGKASREAILTELRKYFSEIKREHSTILKTEIIKKAERVREFTESMDVTQCKLVMGLRSEIAYPDKDVPAMIVMNALFGGTAQSKLFLNVREKLSLCYYCSSKYNKQKGVLFISSGVEKHNLESAKKEILRQLKEVKIGNFTDSELAEIKLHLSQTIEGVGDSLSSLNSWYIPQSFFGNMKSPSKFIKEINEVSREKVIEVANKVTLDTVYTLLCKEEN